MWVANCRGFFECAGDRIPCGYPPGLPFYNCSCSQSCKHLQLPHNRMRRVGQRRHTMNNQDCYGPNVVLPRNEASVRLPSLRCQYSLSKLALSSDGPVCATIDALVNATATGYYDRDGHFITGCRIPMENRLPRTDPCVHIRGDSFTRHMLQAVSMILKGNFVSGAFKRPNVNCLCDGQFSEHPKCRRNYSFPFPCTLAIFESRVVCGSHHPHCTHPGSTMQAKHDKAAFVWFQGGLHYLEKYGERAADAFAKAIRTIAKRKVRKADHFFVSGLHFQTPAADKVFPHQRRELALEFNRQARRVTDEVGGRFVDFATVADGNEFRGTSDGVHYLTSANLLKARIFLALLHMAQKEVKERSSEITPCCGTPRERNGFYN